MSENESTLMGIDQDRVEGWIAANTPLVPPLTWTRLVGGHSNLTYKVLDQRGTLAVVRRPPLGELQPKAHDMNREYRIIKALWETGVPVAEPYGYCEDPAITGIHFYVMGFVHGVYTRYKRGQKSSVGVDMQGFVDAARRSLELAETSVAKLGL